MRPVCITLLFLWVCAASPPEAPDELRHLDDGPSTVQLRKWYQGLLGA